MNDTPNTDPFNVEAMRELLHLQMLNALSADEQQLLDRALTNSETLRAEAAALQQLSLELNALRLDTPSTALLEEARADLRVALRLEQSQKSFAERVLSMLEKLSFGEGGVPVFQFALGAVLLFLMGGLAGYGIFFFSFAAVQNERTASNAMSESAQVANIRFIDPNPADSTLEISFDVVTPGAVSGTVSDKRVKSLLIRALGGGENPGLRLQALTILQLAPDAASDKEIQAALIRSLKFDGNPGVRKNAVALLLQSPRDADIQLALVHVLMNDNNAGIRITAMNALAGGFGIALDNALLGDLRKRLAADDNKYIRIRGDALIDELQQPQSQN
jgi:hypothetical protein